MPEIALEPRPGDSLGPYRITRVIGRGRMGVVFEGNEDGGQPVALKVVTTFSATGSSPSAVPSKTIPIRPRPITRVIRYGPSESPGRGSSAISGIQPREQ